MFLSFPKCKCILSGRVVYDYQLRQELSANIHVFMHLLFFWGWSRIIVLSTIEKAVLKSLKIVVALSTFTYNVI